MTDPPGAPATSLAHGNIGYDDALAQLTAPGRLFEMEDLELGGVRLRAWKHAPPSLRSVLDHSLRFDDNDYLVYEDVRTTYAQHYRIAATLANRLRTELGVHKGDRVAIVMRNMPEWVMAFWGAVAAGAVVVPLNAWWTGTELAYGLEDSGSVVAFVDAERADQIRPHLAGLRDLREVVTAGGPFAEMLGDVAPDAAPPDVDLLPDDDATILYTSGTTGRPKGAVGTHRNACTNLMNVLFSQRMGRLRWGVGLAEPTRPPQGSHLLSVPLFHATGCHAVLVSNTAAGSKIVLMHHFDPERALELIEREKVTVFGGVPTVVMKVLDSPDLERRDTSSLRAVSYGGAPAPADLVRRIRKAFRTGLPGNGYGLTETSAVATFNTGEEYLRKPDSVGRALPVYDAAVVPEGHDRPEPPDLPSGTVGELWLRGPSVVRGYWGRPDETAQAITRGWFHTGDVARIDGEGFIYVVDRAKDVVIRGGENVYSVEVEGALLSHPAVADCAVLGAPHRVLGEEVGAVVVLRPGHKVPAEELADHVRRRLAAFNVPTRFWFRRRPLPRNAAGKLLKRALRAEVLGDPGAVEDGEVGDASAWETWEH